MSNLVRMLKVCDAVFFTDTTEKSVLIEIWITLSRLIFSRGVSLRVEVLISSS